VHGRYLQAPACHAQGYAANSLDTCTGCHSVRSRGILTPRAYSVRAIPVSVSILLDLISRTTAEMLAFGLAAYTDFAARALAMFFRATGDPSMVPLALAAASAALVRSLIRRASSSATAAKICSVSLDAYG
jgi:hypothetical protein